MGGRGAGIGVGSGSWSGNTVGAWNETLRDAIGTKGTPKSIGDAVVETNRHWSRNFREFSQNCQRCIIAYELRRRGYDVEALPTYRGDVKPSIAYTDVKNNVLRGRWLGAFQNAKPESVGVAGDNAQAEAQVRQNIENKMKEYGDGSRAVIQILYRGGGGHVFNVENQGGRTVYVEAQTGKIKDIDKTLKSVKTGSVNIIRTDNLKISNRAKEFVTLRNPQQNVTYSGGKYTDTTREYGGTTSYLSYQTFARKKK